MTRLSLACAALLLLLLLGVSSVLAHESRHSHAHSHKHGLSGPDARVVSAMSAWKSARYAARAAAQERETQLLSGGLEWHKGQNNYTMQRPEGLRDYYIYVPESYDESTPVSFVLAIHGLNDNALHFSQRTNLTAQAEQHGFILAYPQGSTSILGTSWNAGTCCADREVDDVAFIATIMQLVQQTFNTRSDSFHSMGFSNGGFMTERLGCQLSSIFTSIASVSGATILVPGNAQGLANCDALYKSPTSILHIHGNADTMVPWEGDFLLGFPSVPDNMAAWRRRNGCSGSPIQTLNEGTFSNQLWQNCTNGNTQVELVTNQGGQHVYPMDPNGFDTTNYLLAFWNRVTPGGL